MNECIVEVNDRPTFKIDGWSVRCDDIFLQHEVIVRCRDCVYIRAHKYQSGIVYHTCSYFDSEHAEVWPDGFCAWGERKGKK